MGCLGVTCYPSTPKDGHRLPILRLKFIRDWSTALIGQPGGGGGRGAGGEGRGARGGGRASTASSPSGDARVRLQTATHAMHERCPNRPLCAAVVRRSTMSYISLVARAIAPLASSRRPLSILSCRCKAPVWGWGFNQRACGWSDPGPSPRKLVQTSGRKLRAMLPSLCRVHMLSQGQFYGCGTWDVEGLAEAHDELDGLEEGKEEERLLAQLGMNEYYGSEGFDRPPSDVYDGAGA